MELFRPRPISNGMNLFDGKALAAGVIEETKKLIGEKKLSFGVFRVGEDSVSTKFIAEKERVGKELGVDVRAYLLDAQATSKQLRRRIAELVKQTGHDGFILQLPLPEGINTQYVLNAIPETHDADCLNQKSIGAFVVGRSKIIPPVVAAIKTLLENAGVELSGKKIVLVGAGRLVGRPTALWLIAQDLPFTVLTYQSLDLAVIREADIIISGVGQPRLIRGDMIKDGAILIDAGTSSEMAPPTSHSILGVSDPMGSGRPATLVGDIDVASCQDKSGWLVPVPGGVGPLTVAHLFKNLATLAR